MRKVSYGAFVAAFLATATQSPVANANIAGDDNKAPTKTEIAAKQDWLKSCRRSDYITSQLFYSYANQFASEYGYRFKFLKPAGQPLQLALTKVWADNTISDNQTFEILLEQFEDFAHYKYQEIYGYNRCPTPLTGNAYTTITTLLQQGARNADRREAHNQSNAIPMTQP